MLRTTLDRRELLVAAGAGTAALLLPGTIRTVHADLTLPPLPYAFDALEPHIDAKTMEIHHDRHHAAYIDKLKTALMGHESLAQKPLAELLAHLDQVPEAIRTAVRNQGGGHFNHSLFWQMMAPGGGAKNKGLIGGAIDTAFGSFAKFEEAFTKAATGQFGSGWAWLVWDRGKLAVTSTPNQDSPVMQGQVPLLGVDVWEHAYYLKYQNKRPDYVKAWWNVVHWEFVNQRYEEARKHA